MHDARRFARSGRLYDHAMPGTDAAPLECALPHFPDREGALAEGAWVLVAGGLVVVRDVDSSRLRGRLPALGERLVGFDLPFYTESEARVTVAGKR